MAAISLMIAEINHFNFSTAGETISIDYCPLPSIDIMIIPYSNPHIPNTNGLLQTQWTMLLAADWSVRVCMYLAQISILIEDNRYVCDTIIMS